MFARVLTALLALFIVVPAASARSKLEGRIAAKVRMKKKASDRRGLCADFNGAWVGSCTRGDEGTSDGEIKISQYDCADLSIFDGEYTEDIMIAGLETKGWTSFVLGSASALTVTADWESGRQVLARKATGTLRETSPLSNGYYTWRATMRLEGGKLIDESNWTVEGVYDGQPIKTTDSETCTYTRK